MTQHSLLGISGSLRVGSTNRKLMREAARLYGEAIYTEADLNFPLYDGDIENGPGIPDAVLRLAEQIADADGVLIAGPEYNGSISGVLKNALDWISRLKAKPWADKPVAIMSAAAGRAGGVRSQFALRLCLAPFRPRLALGQEMGLADSANQFDAEGRLINDMAAKTLSDLMSALRKEIER